MTDIIERMLDVGRVGPSPEAAKAAMAWMPSLDDIRRVREYVGETAWNKVRESGRHEGEGNLAYAILMSLVNVDSSRASIATYAGIPCAPCSAAAGAPCFLTDVSFVGDDIGLPLSPRICAWRVLAKYGRLEAMELLDRARPPQGALLTYVRRVIIPLSGELDGAVGVARPTHRHSATMTPQRIFISQATNWEIRDIRVDGESIIAPHFNLPGDLFGEAALELPMPDIRQDQQIEIEFRRLHGSAPKFYASVIGTTSAEVKSEPS
jgi:hypothetical protein